MDHDVLFISPSRADAGTLVKMLGPTSVRLDHVLSFQEARFRLRQRPYGAILTEAQLPDTDWTEVLNLTYELNPCPALIVTHRMADDLFWAEVLNRGAYDLLVQPFDTSEVQRILLNACTQTSFRHIPAQRVEKAAKSLSAAL